MDQIAQLNPENLILLLMAFNIVLSATHKALELIKDKTETKADNRLYEEIGRFAGFLKTALEWLSASRKK